MDLPSMMFGFGIAMLLANLWLWIVLPAWRAVGRRRTVECDHPNLVLLQDLKGSDAATMECLTCGDWLLLRQTNGASSSAATGISGDAKNG
jgi:hypothetical protein